MDKAEWKKFFPGFVSGAITTIIFHPLDVAKVRLQVNEGTSVVNYRPKSNRMIGTLMEVYSSKGIAGLYQGLGPNFLGSTVAWGSFFYFYEKSKSFLQNGHPGEELTKGQYSACALGSSAITQLITNPIWLAKTQTILHYESLKESKPKSIFHVIRDNYRQGGIRGIYRGLVPGLMGISHGSIQFVIYESGKNYLNKTVHDRSIDSELSTIEYMTLGSFSKLTATFLTYPFQLMKSRLQDQHRRFNSIIQLFFEITKYEGMKGFYKGLLPNLVRTAPASAVTFLTYEKVKALI